MKKILIATLLMSHSATFSQHISGGGIGTTYSSFLYENNKSGVGCNISLEHMSAWKVLCAKLNGTFAPGTSYGFVTKGFLAAGFTTPLKYRLSWHLLLGTGTYFFNNEVQQSRNAKSLMFSREPTMFLNSGFYYQIRDSLRHRVGVQLYINEEYRQFYGWPEETWAPVVLITYNYLF